MARGRRRVIGSRIYQFAHYVRPCTDEERRRHAAAQRLQRILAGRETDSETSVSVDGVPLTVVQGMAAVSSAERAAIGRVQALLSR